MNLPIKMNNRKIIIKHTQPPKLLEKNQKESRI